MPSIILGVGDTLANNPSSQLSQNLCSAWNLNRANFTPKPFFFFCDIIGTIATKLKTLIWQTREKRHWKYTLWKQEAPKQIPVRRKGNYLDTLHIYSWTYKLLPEENGFALPTSYGVSNFHILICFYSACIWKWKKKYQLFIERFFPKA